MLEKLTKKRNLIFILGVIYLAALWVLYLIFGNDGGKTMLLILFPIVSCAMYGLFRLFYMPFVRFTPFCVTRVFCYVFLGVGAVGSLALLINFITCFPDGLTAGQGVTAALILASIDAARKAIKRRQNK